MAGADYVIAAQRKASTAGHGRARNADAGCDGGFARFPDEPDEAVVVDPQEAPGAHACMLSPPRAKVKTVGRR